MKRGETERGRGRRCRYGKVRSVGVWRGLLLALAAGGLGALLPGSPGGEAQNLPDLQITSPFTVQPGEIEQGGVVSIRAVVTNNETGAVPVAFDVKFQVLREDTGEVRDLSAEEIVCVNAPKSGDPSRCVVPPLAPVGEAGDSFEVRARLDTSFLSPASYVLRAVADPDNVVQERTENNNEGEGFLIVLPRKPNLSILADVRLDPAAPRQGDLLTVEFVVENDRQAGIAAPIPISLGIRSRADLALGRSDFTELIPPAIRCPGLVILTGPQGIPRCALGDGLPGNTRRTVTVQIATAFIEPGEYQMRIFVDPEDDIDTEADESDNVLLFDFTLRAPPSNLTLEAGSLAPSRLLPGQVVTVTFRVRNEGPTALEGVDVALRVRELATGEVRDARDLRGFTCGPVGTVQPGEDRCRDLRLEGRAGVELFAQFAVEGLAFGSYELVIRVDPDDEIPEEAGGGEADNELRLAFAVVEEPLPGPEEAELRPELHPSAVRLTPSSPLPEGGTALVRATVENRGTRDAGAFRVEFALRPEAPASPEGGTIPFQTFAERTFPRLRLGNTLQVQALLDTEALGLQEGVYALRVRVIALEDRELDPNNNDLIVFFSVISPPESSP